MEANSAQEADAYYGDDLVDGEIDMSFLDDNEDK